MERSTLTCLVCLNKFKSKTLAILSIPPDTLYISKHRGEKNTKTGFVDTRPKLLPLSWILTSSPKF